MPGLIEGRDKRMDFDTADERSDRSDLVSLARPQGGVAAMAGQFPNAKPALPGIQDNGDTATRAVPRTALEQPARPSNVNTN
jgi:hypothetical protein